MTPTPTRSPLLSPRRKRAFAALAGLLAWAALSGSVALGAAETSKPLWQIGVPDHNDAEFALAPDGSSRFSKDGLFFVGDSDPKRDWPFIQPGPSDGWAGRRPHTFIILFGLQSAPASGDCSLKIDLADTHQSGPPALRIEINGEAFEQKLPAGGGDASLRGDLSQAKPSSVSIPFPARLLHAGENEIQITTTRGSWMMYDSVALRAPAAAQLARTPARATVLSRVQAVHAVRMQGGAERQPLLATVVHSGAETDATLGLEGGDSVPIHLKAGRQTLELLAPVVSADTKRTVVVQAGGQTLASRQTVLKPVRKITIYVLPHSHTDIGYTEIQTAIEKKQVNNLLEGIAAARKTASYPEGARFVWNVEVLWAADLYLHRLNDQQRADFFDAVKRGQVSLNGMYLNELTGLCRPEELVRLFDYSTRLGRQTGVPIDSAMISDVPGYTWGTVTAMAQAGIKYFSVAPNYFDRIGDILVQWENKPFYWVSPSGKEKVLVWIPYSGYALSHRIQKFTPEFVSEYQETLDRMNYPYDISYLRWSGHGDNAVPDPEICEFIKDWNANNVWPKFVISSTSDAFRAFEQRYGPRIPQVRGDWTPYWEDGAGSSALETAMNRASSDRLTQAETAWAMVNPAGYPASSFEEAWNNVLLYSEHTWGAWCSVSDPENQKTKEQWEIKRSYAVQADEQSRALLNRVLPPAASASGSIEVLNTASWPRTEVAVVSAPVSAEGDRVTDEAGRPVPSQRLAGGELAFLVRDLPPFAARRYSIGAGAAFAEGKATAKGAILDNGLVRVRVDKKTGGIVDLRAKGVAGNLASPASGQALNEYLFLPGDNLADLQRNGAVTIHVKEKGPLVASLLIESSAPGCNRLSREVRLCAGFDYVELINTVDKQRAPISPQPGEHQFAQKGGKEAVHFAFPFHVPHGEMRVDLPLGSMRPEIDQFPSACKNWFTVGRWVDVANSDCGVTWVTLDAPLIEIGGITATLLGSQTDPTIWRKKVEPTQTLYSWAMNNHWGTNYRAYQDGPVVFRFVLRPHGKASPDAATRLATGFSQPLLVTPASGRLPAAPRLKVAPQGVTVSALKPSDDGKALIVELYGAGGKDAEAELSWAAPQPVQLWLSDTSQRPIQKINGRITVPAWGLVTLRADLSN